LFSVQSKLLVAIAALVAMNAAYGGLSAQDDVDAANKSKPRSRNATGATGKTSQRTATIHWQRVPLRDAIGRLHSLFDDTVFVDRRVDPSMRISLDIEATSAEDVIAAIAAGRDLGAARLGRLVYLGPSGAANQLRGIAAARSQEVGRLPAESRSLLTQKQTTTWPRLGAPRGLIASIIEHRGWRLANADAIPHDLWSAGELPGLTFAEQLTVLLIGFDLTFELGPSDRSVAVVPLKDVSKPPIAGAVNNRSATPANSTHAKKEGKHVYTLRVQEKPVGAVLQELSKRLHWAIQIDEESMRTAGKSLDTRVSFSVENVDQVGLLEALLRPAGLDYRLDGERVRVIAGRHQEK
jgi:hypothetical protein